MRENKCSLSTLYKIDCIEKMSKTALFKKMKISWRTIFEYFNPYTRDISRNYYPVVCVLLNTMLKSKWVMLLVN